MKTHLFFDPADVEIFVEPQDFATYSFVWPDYTIRVLERNDAGISYVRNYILDSAAEDVLMLDDDINYFAQRTPQGRYDKLTSLKALRNAFEEGIRLENCAIYSIVPLEENPFAYHTNVQTQNKRFHTNSSQMIACYAFNIDAVNQKQLRFDENISEGEDADLLIQTILSGFDVVTDYEFAFSHDIRTAGGLSFSRDAIVTMSECAEQSYNSLAHKYGDTFLQKVTDTRGDFKSMKIQFAKLIAQSREGK